MTRHPAISIDLGAHSIKAAQCDRNGRTRAFSHLPRNAPGAPLDADDIKRLSGLLYRRGFHGSRVEITAPKSIVHRLTIDLPPLDSGAPISTIAQTELCRQRHIDPGSFEFHWFETPQPPRHNAGARAIAVSCTHEDANALLDLFEQGGFQTVALRCPISAVAAARRGSNPHETTAVLDLGWSDATLVSCRNGVVRFARSMPNCGLAAMAGTEDWIIRPLGEAIRGLINHGPAHEADLDDFAGMLKRYEQSLVSEVGSSIRYLEGCEGDEAPRSIEICGGGSVLPGVRAVLRRETELPVQHTPEAVSPSLPARPIAIPDLRLTASPQSDTYNESTNGDEPGRGPEPEPVRGIAA